MHIILKATQMNFSDEFVWFFLSSFNILILFPLFWLSIDHFMMCDFCALRSSFSELYTRYIVKCLLYNHMNCFRMIALYFHSNSILSCYRFLEKFHVISTCFPIMNLVIFYVYILLLMDAHWMFNIHTHRNRMKLWPYLWIPQKQ